MTKITPAALRSAAAKQKVGKPLRYGIHYSWFNADNLDNAIVARQQAAKRWRTDLADDMDANGVTSLRAETRWVGSRWGGSFRATVYLHADGSVFRYRRVTDGKPVLRSGDDWRERTTATDGEPAEWTVAV